MLKNIPAIHLSDFQYTLPEERIAKYPLTKRDDAKLQVYVRGEIAHSQFYKLHYFLPSHTLLVFNNTKVVPARLYFSRATGAVIEIFLLQPHSPALVTEAMQQTTHCTWKCLVGNKRRWKPEETLIGKFLINDEEYTVEAQLLDREAQLVSLRWQGGSKPLTLAELLIASGEIPLPPYLKRETEESDRTQYQTVYSEREGAVAAPTAGLHFTDEVLNNLDKKGIKREFITLHVGGGTFQPIKTKRVVEHPMHAEQMIFSLANVEALLKHHQHIVAVGTTSMRALESLYWYGVKLREQLKPRRKPTAVPFHIEKLYPYYHPTEQLPSLEQALETIIKYMRQYELAELVGDTEIFIFPGYQFRVCKGLITNYHLPGTTLILLVAAFIGEDWRKVYQEALDNDYRFLSYGDSSLLLP